MTNSGNSRIAKNTIFMYMRMLLIMVVSLFTSRVVLQTLGEADFGTYNIVGGVVVLFTFINSAMATGTQRHLSYELGKPDGDVKTIFSACLKIHIFLALIILVLAETIGLWFLNAKMNFPEGRMVAVNWIYQFSVLACIIGIIKVPYNAAIIAYERMSFYAYSSIVEVIAKLVIVYLLVIIPFDKLIVYALLILGISVFMQGWYMLYCRRLSGIKYVKVKDKGLYKQLLSFSGWALFGSVANMGYQQGVNIIINLFYGVTLNAAVGIANQVNHAINQFATSFQQALNPQLVQSEASKNRDRQMDLIFKSSKFSYLIMACLAFPLILNLNEVLALWLGKFPEHTEAICEIIILGALLETLSGPLWVSIFATGKIKYYQIIVSTILLLNLPFSYIGGRFGMAPEGMYVIRLALFVLALITRLIFLKKYIGLQILKFINKVIVPTASITVILFITYFVVYKYNIEATNFVQLLYQSIIAFAFVSLLSFFIGLTRNERSVIIDKVKSYIRK